MLVDILVPVVFVDLEAQRRQLGQEDVRQAGVDQQGQPLPRVGRGHQLDELVPHPLGRHHGQRRRARRHRGIHLRRDDEPELRCEPGRPHHPQWVVGEGFLGRGGRAQPAGRQIGEPAVQVDELQRRQPQRHGVDGEVAPHEVGGERVAEGHHRLAGRAVVHIEAIGRDLDQRVALAQPDRAEVAADLPVRVGPAPDHREGVIRRGVGREVEVGCGASEKGVAHRAADEGEFVAGGCEAFAELAQQGQRRGQGRDRCAQQTRIDRGTTRHTPVCTHITAGSHNAQGYRPVARARVTTGLAGPAG